MLLRAKGLWKKFGNLQADEVTARVLSLALEFLHEHQPQDNPPEGSASSHRQLLYLPLGLGLGLVLLLVVRLRANGSQPGRRLIGRTMVHDLPPAKTH